MTAPVMVRLRDLGDWTGGNTPSKANSAYWTNGTVPWVSPKDMKVEEVTSSEDQITAAALKERRVSLVPKGSVLIVTRSGILSHTLPIAVTRLPVTINQDLKALVPKPSVSPKYVAHALRGASHRILKTCLKQGTTVASIETDALLNFEIPMVGLEEQGRVVAEIEKQFSRLDEATANLQRVKAGVKRYRASILKAAVEGRLVPGEAELACREGRRYESADEFLAGLRVDRDAHEGKRVPTHEREENRQTALPRGWCWALIGQLGAVVRGASPRPAGDPRFFGGKVPWITVGPITANEDEYLWTVPDGLTEPGKERSRYIEPGTLLLTNSGATLGVPKISKIGGCINDGVAAILGVNDPLKLYLLYFLRTRTIELRRIKQGAAQPNLNTAIIKSIAVPLPPPAEQRRIVDDLARRLSSLKEMESQVELNIVRTGRTRQAVLGRLINGRR